LIQVPGGKSAVTIPSSVTSIGEMAFSSCSVLTSVTFETGSLLTTIGKGAFNVCRVLTNISLPESVTTINEQAFQYCATFTSISIPSGVGSIGNNAFTGCASLTEVTFVAGSNIANDNFGDSAFPEESNGLGGNTLKTAYANAVTKSGTYTRATNGPTWAKN